MREKRFSHCLRVRYGEVDMQRFVFNPNYMNYVEVALNEYLRETLGPYYAMLHDPGSDFEISLVKSEMEFLRPAGVDDLLNISCAVVKVGNASFVMEYEFRRDGEEELLVKAVKTYVSMDLKKGKSAPLPAEVKRRFVEYEGLVSG